MPSKNVVDPIHGSISLNDIERRVIDTSVFQRLRGQDKTGGDSYGLPIDGNEVENLAKSSKLFGFDDSFVDRIIQKAAYDEDPVIRSLAQRIVKRKRLPLIREIFVLSSERHNAGTNFETNCRFQLSALAETCETPLGQFLF